MREHIMSCEHSGCGATRRLEIVGAWLQLGMGRHCEIAMVAATGLKGLASDEVVATRREYSIHPCRHGAKKLLGPSADAT